MTETAVNLCNNDCEEEKRDFHIFLSFTILFFIGIIILFTIKPEQRLDDTKFIDII